jgi:hypothetical protein
LVKGLIKAIPKGFDQQIQAKLFITYFSKISKSEIKSMALKAGHKTLAQGWNKIDNARFLMEESMGKRYITLDACPFDQKNKFESKGDFWR